jgi:hypothetical protein
LQLLDLRKRQDARCRSGPERARIAGCCSCQLCLLLLQQQRLQLLVAPRLHERPLQQLLLCQELLLRGTQYLRLRLARPQPSRSALLSSKQMRLLLQPDLSS